MCGWSFCLRTNLLRPLSNGCEQCIAEAAVGGYRLENVPGIDRRTTPQPGLNCKARLLGIAAILERRTDVRRGVPRVSWRAPTRWLFGNDLHQLGPVARAFVYFQDIADSRSIEFVLNHVRLQRTSLL